MTAGPQGDTIGETMTAKPKRKPRPYCERRWLELSRDWVRTVTVENPLGDEAAHSRMRLYYATRIDSRK